MQPNQIVGAIKIKDGFFIGDQYAAQVDIINHLYIKDPEFICQNKVSHIINCAAQQLQNKFQNLGVKYLNFNWQETDQQILFDEKGENVNSIVEFIDECFDEGQSCLVHSVKGQSRSCCVLACYFMKKYNWSLYKTLEFLNSRRPDLEIRASFFYQLNALETKLSNAKRTTSWNDFGTNSNEELVLRNTFLNSRNAAIDAIYTDISTKLVNNASFNLKNTLSKFQKQKIKWADKQLAKTVFQGPADFLPNDKIVDTKKTLKSAMKKPQEEEEKKQEPTQNDKFKNLLMSCAKQKKNNENLTQGITRSTSLQQFSDKDKQKGNENNNRNANKCVSDQVRALSQSIMAIYKNTIKKNENKQTIAKDLKKFDISTIQKCIMRSTSLPKKDQEKQITNNTNTNNNVQIKKLNILKKVIMVHKNSNNCPRVKKRKIGKFLPFHLKELKDNKPPPGVGTINSNQHSGTNTQLYMRNVQNRRQGPMRNARTINQSFQEKYLNNSNSSYSFLQQNRSVHNNFNESSILDKSNLLKGISGDQNTINYFKKIISPTNGKQSNQLIKIPQDSFSKIQSTQIMNFMQDQKNNIEIGRGMEIKICLGNKITSLRNQLDNHHLSQKVV